MGPCIHEEKSTMQYLHTVVTDHRFDHPPGLLISCMYGVNGKINDGYRWKMGFGRISCHDLELQNCVSPVNLLGLRQ